MLEVVLPNLVFPHWEFNYENHDDQVLGELICDMVGPSLRKLRNLLQIASQMARHYEQQLIDTDMIIEAFSWSASKADQRRLAESSSGKEVTLKETKSSRYEEQSAARHDAKS
mgnify:FL=1